MAADLELVEDLAADDEARLGQAQALVRRYCGWHIAPSREATLTVLEATRTIILPSLNVTAVSVVQDEETTPSDAYWWTSAGVVSARCGWWSAGAVVTYTHGYADAPEDVTAVVQAVAQRAIDNPRSLVRTQAGPFADTFSQSGFNQSLPLVLLDGEKDVLNPYRLPPRP